MSTLAASFRSIQHQSNSAPDDCYENPIAGVYDGANTDYTLQTICNATTLKLSSKNSGGLVQGVDYSITGGKQISILGSPLLDGDYLIGEYKRP